MPLGAKNKDIYPHNKKIKNVICEFKRYLKIYQYLSRYFVQ